MDLKGIFFLVVIGSLFFFGCVVWDRVNRSNRGVAFLREQGVSLDYYYKNFIGISQAKQKLFINVGVPLLLNVSQVRRIEKNSILQTKSNAWGMQFHKERNCVLAIHSDDLAQPSHAIGFDTPQEMELWYSRLCAFCNLS